MLLESNGELIMKKQKSTNMKPGAILILAVFSLLILIAISGCKKEELTVTKDRSKTGEKSVIERVESTPNAEKKDSAVDPEGVITIKLYFPNETVEKLICEERQVPLTDNIAEVSMRELFAGPKEPGRLPVIPLGLKLPKVTIEGELASVDFTEELKNLYPTGSTGENMFIFAIVNTLVDNTDAKSVRFLINGEPADIVGSNYDLKEQIFKKL